MVKAKTMKEVLSKEFTLPQDANNEEALKAELWPLLSDQQKAWVTSKLAMFKDDSPNEFMAKSAAGTRVRLLKQWFGLTRQGLPLDYEEPTPGVKIDWSEYGIPARYHAIGLETLHEREDSPSFNTALNATAKYVDSIKDALRTGRGPIFCGDIGTGKTALAAIIAKEAVRAGWSAQFITAGQLVANLIKLNGEAYTRFRHTMEATGLLVVDDYGAQYHHELGESKLDEVFGAREAEMRPTIITCNFYKEGLKEVMDGRSWDRLTTWNPIYEIQGGSFRGRVNP